MPDLNRNEKTWCFGCQQLKERTGFIFSLNPWHSKYLPLCRSCITERFKKYVEATNSESGALWCMCAEMGYPVVKKYYDLAVQRKEETERMNLFVAYHNILKEKRFKMEGFWQSDVMLSDIMLTAVDMENEEKWLEQQEKVWGKFEKKDYELLNDFFSMYTKDLFSLDTAMELRYRDLCKAELRKRKADESGDITEITKAQDSIRKNLELLKLDKFQSNTKTEVEKTLEYQIAMMEKYKPAELEDISQYEDFCGCHNLENQLMRPLRNLIAGTREYPTVTKE